MMLCEMSIFNLWLLLQSLARASDQGYCRECGRHGENLFAVNSTLGRLKKHIFYISF